MNKRRKREFTGRVIRISTEMYDLLNKLRGKRSFSDYLGQTAAMLKQKPVYVLPEHVILDISEARGQAVIISVTQQKPIEMPMIVVPIGWDKIK